MSTAGILRWLRGLTVVDDEDAGERPPLHLLRFTTHAELNENESAVDLFPERPCRARRRRRHRQADHDRE